MAIRMEGEMPRPIARRQRNRGGSVGCENSAALIEPPDENPIQSQIDVQHKAPRGIGLDHVSVRSVVSAEGETSRRSIRGLPRSNGAAILLDIRGGTESAVW